MFNYALISHLMAFANAGFWWKILLSFESCIFKMYFVIKKTWPSVLPEMDEPQKQKVLMVLIVSRPPWSPHLCHVFQNSTEPSPVLLRVSIRWCCCLSFRDVSLQLVSWSLGGAQGGGSVCGVTQRFLCPTQHCSDSPLPHHICSILDFGVLYELVFYPSLWLCGTLKINSQDYYFLSFIGRVS